MSKPLSKDKVLEAIKTLPKRFRDLAMKEFRSTKPMRHGSAAFGRKHPSKAVKSTEHAIMAKMNASGLSFRAIEGVFHLHPMSGNDAYRCVENAKKHDKTLRKTCRLIARNTKADAKRRALAEKAKAKATATA